VKYTFRLLFFFSIDECRYYSLAAVTTGVIIEENTGMLHEIYRTIRRYQAVRGLMKELKVRPSFLFV